MKKINNIALSIILPTALVVGVVGCSHNNEHNQIITQGNATKISGIDLDNFDKSVRLQDDLYRGVNGQWLKNTVIPADKSSYGSFSKLYDDSQVALKEIIEDAAKSNGIKGSNDQKMGDFYNSFMDLKNINAKGIQPLENQLHRIEKAKNHSEIINLIASLHQVGIKMPFGYYTGADAKNSTINALYFYQSGLTLPDRDYYLKDTDKFLKVRTQYKSYIKKLLTEAGYKHSDKAAHNIMTIEKGIAKAQWSRVESRNATKRYNKMSHSELNKLMGSFDFDLFVNSAHLQRADEVIVSQPSYMKAFGRIFESTSLQAWKDYLSFQLVDNYAELLSQEFVDLYFEFHSKTLAGVEKARPRWKKAVSAADDILGEMLGELYVKKYFPPTAKIRMEAMIKMLLKGFKVSINELEWMSDETKIQALDKLSKFTYKIGYPDKWHDYSTLRIDADDLVGNYQRAVQLEFNEMIDDIGQPVDKSKWGMNPQTVNAYYNPVGNEIVFPAAILQPPFFDMTADDAVNYGAIGAVIGHEISHGFDDQGAKYDGEGNLRDWWTDSDKAEFEKRTKKLSKQYSAFKPFDDASVNGDLTLGENIGDLGGLTVAFHSYLLSLNGKKSTIIDGFTGEQRFFIGWSQVWRQKYRDQALRNRLLTDPHSPSKYRAFGTPRNVEAFYKAFNIMPSDKMYLKPQDRVKIW